VIEYVEGLRAKLKARPLGDGEVLEQGHVEVGAARVRK
jgi:hypothetical protein